jgi:hypothetical protein
VYDDGDGDVLDAIAAMAQDGDGDVEDRPERVYWWEKRALRCNEKHWRMHFRVSKNVFNFVLDKIISHDVFRVARNIARPVPVEKQLAVFLWRVGRSHPGVATVAEKFEVSSSTVVAITSRVAQAIRERLGHMVHMPKSGALKKEMTKGFTDRGYKGGVVVIDGTGVNIVPPTKMTRAGQRHVFVGKSSGASKRYQIACDSTMRIRHVFGGNPGSVHDMDLFKLSPHFVKIREYLQAGEYYIADAGYALRPYMMIPFKKAEIDGQPQHIADARTLFNRHYSGSARIVVERCIGVLKARFSSLLKGMWFRDASMYSVIFETCCILHHVCLDFRDAWSDSQVRSAIQKIRLQERLYRRAVPRPLSNAGGSLADGQARRKAVMLGATGSAYG